MSLGWANIGQPIAPSHAARRIGRHFSQAPPCLHRESLLSGLARQRRLDVGAGASSQVPQPGHPASVDVEAFLAGRAMYGRSNAPSATTAKSVTTMTCARSLITKSPMRAAPD